MSYGHERTAAAAEALSTLRNDLAHLADLQGTGPVRRRAGWGPRPEQIAATGRQHIAERADVFFQLRQGLAPIGASPAPADLVVLDTLRDVSLDLADLLDAVCDRIAPRVRRSTTNPRRIGQLITLLTKVGADDDLLDHVLTETRRMHRAVKHAIGDTEEIRRLTQRCPHCRALSLRALMDRGTIVCTNASCRCGDLLCPCHNDRPRRHTWAITDLMETAA